MAARAGFLGSRSWAFPISTWPTLPWASPVAPRGAVTPPCCPPVSGLAATWDLNAAHLYGSVIGRELRDQGYNMSIGGGVDITREPRNGRNFEYAGEDPILAGKTVGTAHEGSSRPAHHGRPQTLRAERPGNRTQYRQRGSRQALHAGDRPPGVRDRVSRVAGRGRDVLLQQGKRGLRL